MNILLVIRTYNDSRQIERALTSYFREGFSPSEIVLADCASSDNTVKIAESFGVRAYVDPVWSAGERTNRAVSKFGGDFIAVLDSDMEATPGFGDELRALVNRGVECLVIPEISVAASTTLSKARAFERSLFAGDATIEAARGFSRRIWEECGGFTGPPGVDDWILGVEASRRAPTAHMSHGVLHHELPLTAMMTFKKYSNIAFGQGFLWLLKRDPKAFLTHGNPIRPGIRRNAMVLLRRPKDTAGLIAFKSLVYAGGVIALARAILDDVKTRIRAA